MNLSTSMLFIILLSVLAAILAIGLIACYWNRGWLSIGNAANLATIFGSIAAGGSLVFIAVQMGQQATQLQLQTDQLKLQTSLARASNSQSFVNASSDFVLAIGGDSTLMKLYNSGGDGFEKLGAEEQAQYRYLVAWWLTFYENVVYQHECKLLDLGVYQAWMNDMRGFIRRRRVEKVWDKVKDNYSTSFNKNFQEEIDVHLDELKQQASPSPTVKP